MKVQNGILVFDSDSEKREFINQVKSSDYVRWIAMGFDVEQKSLIGHFVARTASWRLPIKSGTLKQDAEKNWYVDFEQLHVMTGIPANKIKKRLESLLLSGALLIVQEPDPIIMNEAANDAMSMVH